jgi:hypothetical protein
MRNVGSLSSIYWGANFFAPRPRKRSLSMDETTDRKKFIAARVENGQTPNEYTFYSTPPKSNAENLIQKFKDFWKQIGEILRPALDFICDLILKTKIHKLCSLSWNVVKIKSIFSFTWQQSSPTSERSDPPINVQGNFIANQTLIFTGMPQSSSSEIALQCKGCGHHTVHSLVHSAKIMA